MTAAAAPERRKVRFLSEETECVAWLYPGRNGAGVVMAAGGAITKEPGTDPFASRFNEAGFTVLAFDYRRLGESGGRPRQIIRVAEQLADWHAAIAFSRTLAEIENERLAIWGASLSGGHVLRVASEVPELAGAIALAPLVDGRAAMPNALRSTTPFAFLRLNGRAAMDSVRGLLGREPLLIPLVGKRGEVAMLTTPDAQTGPEALDPEGRYPEWQQEIAARSALRIGFYRPGRRAGAVTCPLLVLAFEADGAAPPAAAISAAERAPRGELSVQPGGHYEAFMGGHQRAAETQVSFLTRHLLVAGSEH